MAGEEDDSQKTEEPTQKKIDDTRKKGQVPLSREFNNWIMLLAGTILLAGFGGDIMSDLFVILRSIVEQSAFARFDAKDGHVGEVLSDVLFKVAGVLAMPMLFFVIAAIVGPFSQVGPLLSFESIKPSLNKISPIQGFKRIFSLRSIMEFVKGVIKISLVCGIGAILLYPYMTGVEHFMMMPVQIVLSEISVLFLKMMAGVLSVLFALAVLDVFYQRFEHLKKIRMSKQEIKDEYKQAEGDPHVKGRLRQLRAQRAKGRMMQAVPEADVVITNPTHYSIALKYDPAEMQAPVVVAKGVNDVAMRIREVAKEHDITIYEEPPLARALFDTVEIDEAIPEEHFKAVAKIISYVFQLKGKI